MNPQSPNGERCAGGQIAHDYMRLATACLAACVTPPPKGGPMRGDGRGGPLWDVTIHAPGWMIARVIQFAQDGQRLTYNGAWASITNIAGTDTTLVVGLACGTGRFQVAVNITTPYPDDLPELKTVATGNWLKGPYGEVRLKHLMPKVVATDYGAEIFIDAEARRQFKGWFGKDREIGADIESIRLSSPTNDSPNYRARIETPSRVKNFFLPDVVFVEPQ